MGIKKKGIETVLTAAQKAAAARAARKKAMKLANQGKKTKPKGGAGKKPPVSTSGKGKGGGKKQPTKAPVGTKGKGGAKKKATKPKAPSFWTSLNTARKDIGHSMGIGSRAFKKSIGKKDVSKWPTAASAHVGRHPKKYATGTIIGAGHVGKKQGTSKGRRQATHDLKL